MIIYVSICRALDAAMLAESMSPELGGNAHEVMQLLMERLSEIPEAMGGAEQKTFSQKNQNDFFGDWVASCTGGYVNMDGGIEHFFHVYLQDGVYYACIGDDRELKGQYVNFDFLRELAKDFVKEFGAGKIKRCRAMALHKKFRPNIQSKSHYYNINHEKLGRNKKVQNMLDQVEDMKLVMDQNIRLVLQHQEDQLQTMTEQSEVMKQDTQVFKKRAEILLVSQKRKRNFRYCLWGGVLLGLAYLLLAAQCGFTFSYCGAKRGSNNNNSGGNSGSNSGGNSNGNKGGN